MIPNPTRLARAALRRGFTIMELMVVIAIITILLVIAIPSFRAMIRSSEEALADSLLKAGLRAGRDAALQSPSGSDAAAVFFFEPGGRLTVVTYIQAGTIVDEMLAQGTGTGNVIDREVFVPAPGFRPIALPSGWMVSGSVPASAVEPQGDWYSGTGNNARYPAATANWVFPETGFFDADTANQGSNRCSFMVRFKAGTGELVSSPSNPVLVLAPRPKLSRTDESGGAWLTTWANPLSNRWANDPFGFVRAVTGRRISDPDAPGTAHVLTDEEMREVLGHVSSDTVLARPVTVLTLYDINRMASALGVRVDRDTGSLYRAVEPGSGDGPRFLENVTAARMNAWIEGDTNLDNVISAGQSNDRAEARLFSINHYTGTLLPLEVVP